MNELPALDRRPSPAIAVVPLYVVGVVVAIALAALVFLKIDRTVSGRGVLVPPGDALVVAALRSGVVVEVVAREGQVVEKGDALVRLDDQEDRAAVDALGAQVDAQRSEVERRGKLRTHRKELYAVRGERLRTEASAEEAGLRAAKVDAEASVRDAERRKHERQRMGTLAQQGALSPTAMEETDRRADDARTEVARVQAQVEQKRLTLERLKGEGSGIALEGSIAEVEDELAALEAQASLASLERLLAEARLRMQRATIVAPAAGTVHALAVHAPGELVKEGQTVCRIVPPGEGLFAEVQVSSTDIGFVQPGLPARLKLDAFPFEDFGALNGRVYYVAPDATPADPNRPERLPVYVVRIRADAGHFSMEAPAKAQLLPGMTLTAELVGRKESLAVLLFRPMRGAARDLGLR